MKVFNNELYLQVKELVDAGIPDRTIRYWKEQEEITSIQEGTAVFIPYNSLRPSWRQTVDLFFGGSAMKFYQFERISADLVYKKEDAQIIDQYRIPGTKLQLEESARNSYKACCAFLCWLPTGRENRWYYGVSFLADFWQLACDYVKHRGLKLPQSRRLEWKMQDYLQHGPMGIISAKYGNSNGSGLNDLQRALLVELMTDGRKFTKKEVMRQFRSIALEKGWERAASMTDQGLYNYINDAVNEWEKDRHGEKWFMLNRQLSINQRRVSQPHYQWQADGTPAALWYLNDQGQPDKLYTLSIMDSHSMNTVGYAIGFTETTNLVAEALKMAIKLNSCVPHELRTDKGSAFMSGETKGLLKNLDIRLIPTATGRARAKSIELQQRWWIQNVTGYYLNKSGMNLDAKSMDSKQNPDFFKANKHLLPTKEELIQQIRESFAIWNNLEGEDGRTPAERLADAAPDKKEMSPDRLLESFGIWRKKGKNLIKYQFTLEGLEMQIDKKTFRYLPVAESTGEQAKILQRNMFVTEFYCKYDPTDIEQIALYILPEGKEETEENLRFWGFAELKHLSAQSLREANDKEKDAYKKQREIQRKQGKWIEQESEKRKEMLQAENVLSGALDHKTVRKDAYNKAKIELQRLASMGFGNEINTEELERIHCDQEDDGAVPVESSGKKLVTSINIYKGKFKD